MLDNIMLLTDSYKISHYKQYPKGTEEVYSYFESRGGEFDETVFFGLQYIIQKYLSKPITREQIEEADELITDHLGLGVFNKSGWEYILEKHEGYLPIQIRAVPEGTVVPNHNVLMTVVNTDPACYWLTNYIETLLVQVWYPTTVATVSRDMKKKILRALMSTGDPSLIDFKLHDFGFRGVSSVESAGIGGAAHLINFKGTDTIAALEVVKKYYGERMAGFSIPASEHSTITSWGRENELEAYRNMLEAYPAGLVACVSDSYDIYSACRDLWGDKLRADILGRDGCLVVRPDSGVPHEVVPKILSILGQAFPTTVNSKGYRVLDPHIRIIQGDGVDLESLEKIIGAMTAAGWSADNIAYGMGGALLQKVNRDTQKFAFKCSSVTVNGVQRDVFKDPVGAPWKASKRGKLALTHDLGDWKTVTATNEVAEQDELQIVFHDGFSYVDTFQEIRDRAVITL